MDCGPKRGRGLLFAGLLVIALGVILLLNQFGLLPHGLVLNFWPAVLIVVGIIKLFAGTDRGDRVVGAILIGVGAVWQTNALGLTHISWGQAWPVFIILVGVLFIVHSMSNHSGRNLKFSMDPEPGSFYIFGGGERHVKAKDFRGSKMFAVFGGYEVDLTQADMEGTEAYVEANAVFGGGEIRIPTNWKVVVQGVGIFGGYNDKTHYIQTDPSAPVKTLYVRGVAVFGGIEVKN
jgi:predicted membrane protein